MCPFSQVLRAPSHHHDGTRRKSDSAPAKSIRPKPARPKPSAGRSPPPSPPGARRSSHTEMATDPRPRTTVVRHQGVCVESITKARHPRGAPNRKNFSLVAEALGQFGERLPESFGVVGPPHPQRVPQPGTEVGLAAGGKRQL